MTKPAHKSTKSGTKTPGNKRLRRRRTFLYTLAGLVAIMIASVVLVYRYITVRHDGERTMIYLPEGLTDDALTDSLEAHLDSRMASRVASMINGAANARPGAYAVGEDTPAWRLARNIRNGRQTPVRVTFNNIVYMDALARRISGRMAFSADDFIAAVDTILVGNGYDHENVLTAFTPDTYEFYWTDPASKVVRRLHDHNTDIWNSSRKSKAKQLGLTPAEVAILASIVEEESSKHDEYGKIARLYLNRLDRGMKLQADPTVKRAVGNRSLQRITARHLRVKSPYNTYLYKGLPPGPLRIPDTRTIDAVLDAPQHDYLYMCASPDFSGHHIFAADYETHRANARRYQAALDARNIH